MIRRPIPPHHVSSPFFGRPAVFFPAYGFYPFGFYGNGFCDPFWGFDPGFGCGGLGFGFGYGYSGFGYGYPGYFGGGYDNSYSVGSTTGPSDFENDAPSDNSGGYSPAPLLQQGTDQSSPAAAPAPPPAATVIYLKDGTSYEVMSYWLDAGKLHYITNYGGETTVDMGQLDLQRTVDENARAGASFTLRPAAPASSTQSTPEQTEPQQ